MQRPLRREHLALLLVVLLIAGVLRGVHPGADIPFGTEGTGAPILDAFWYMESAAGPAEGSTPERLSAYDIPVWSSLARLWLEVFGVSLGSVQALGACVSLCCILLTWRILRAGLGDTAALSGAAVMAVMYPYVALSRTTLIYGPVTLALLVAAAIWLRSRRLTGPVAVAHVAGAALLVVGATLAVRPPAFALAGGLVLAALVRWPRLRRSALVLCFPLALFGAAFLASPDVREAVLGAMKSLGGVFSHNADRIARKLDPNLTPTVLLQRALTWGVAPTAGEIGLGPGNVPLDAPGLFLLAPGALTVAGLGGVLAVSSRQSLTPARKETLALFFGWGLAFVAFSLFMGTAHRPLRYYVLLAPPIAAFVGYGTSWVFDPRHPPTGWGPGQIATFAERPAPPRAAFARLLELDPCLVLAVAACGALLWPHLAVLLIGPIADGGIVQAGLQGAGMGLVVLGVGAILSRKGDQDDRLRWVGLAIFLLLALAPGATKSVKALTHLSSYGMHANQAIPKILDRSTAVLVGPYASYLALGHGIERRRAGNFRTDPGYFEGTLRLLQPEDGPWATHLVVDQGQERTAQVVKRFSQRGLELQAVAVLTPQGPNGIPVFVFRFPWACDQGYRLSPHEQRLLDLEGDGEAVRKLHNAFVDSSLR